MCYTDDNEVFKPSPCGWFMYLFCKTEPNGYFIPIYHPAILFYLGVKFFLSQNLSALEGMAMFMNV